MTDYLLLFGSSFLAATILPFYSEIVLVAKLNGGANTWGLIAVATTGNVLGAWINWWLGKWLLHFQHKRWFYFSEKQISRAQHWFNRYGVWTLLFAWLPIGGDALTLIAGVMRVHVIPFLILVTIGKFARYVVVAQVANGL